MPEQIISIVIWTFGEDSLDTAQHSNLRIVLNIYIHVQPSIARIRKLKKDLAMCTLVIYAVQKNLNQMSHRDWEQTNCYFQYLPD